MSLSHPLQNQRGCSKSFDDGQKVWCFGNVLRPDAMKLDIEAAEPHAWVHKGCESFNPIVRSDAGYANLANAGGVTAGRLDIKSDEPEVSSR